MKKLYILIRSDLEQGLQLAQTAHAAIAFALENLEPTQNWNRDSNNIAILSVKNEEELRGWIKKANEKNITSAIFSEPDLGGQWTAASFLPEDGRIFSSLPRAGKPPKGFEVAFIKAA